MTIGKNEEKGNNYFPINHVFRLLMMRRQQIYYSKWAWSIFQKFQKLLRFRQTFFWNFMKNEVEIWYFQFFTLTSYSIKSVKTLNFSLFIILYLTIRGRIRTYYFKFEIYTQYWIRKYIYWLWFQWARVSYYTQIFYSITILNDLCFQLSSDKQSFNSEKKSGSQKGTIIIIISLIVINRNPVLKINDKINEKKTLRNNSFSYENSHQS
jgi:hypothetical protein